MMEESCMKWNPKVTIAIPVYNGSKYMREAIDSALSQTYNNIEVIIVNDGSTDNSEEIALSYGEKVRYYKKENGGVASALNVAIDHMTGEYFQYLPHDDILNAEKIEKQIHAIQKSGDIHTIVWSGWSKYIQKEQSIKKVEIPYEYKNYNRITEGVYPLFFGLLNTVTVLIHKSYFEEKGKFDEHLFTSQDYDMWFRLFQNQKTVFLDEDLVHYRWHDEQGTQADEEFINNCKILARQMRMQIDGAQIERLFGTKYEFYYYLLNYYYSIGWFDCAKELLPLFLDMEEPESVREAREIFSGKMKAVAGHGLALYCAGKNAVRLIHILEERGIKVDLLCDNSAEKQGRELAGILCESRNAIRNKNMCVIITKDFPDEQVAEFKKEGYQNVTSFEEIGSLIYGIVPEREQIIKSWEMYMKLEEKGNGV